MNDQTIFKFTGAKSGETVAIFAGVHGNELAGIKVLDYLQNNLQVEAGTVYLVYANPKAIQENVRFTEKNLNRCFTSKSKGGVSYEEQRAVELMELLDSCDALLDLHAYHEPYGESTPFVICELNSFDIVKNFDLGIVISGIDPYQPGGTDAYMSNKGKVGICVELGAIETPENFVELGVKTAYQFLQYYGMTSKQYENDTREQLYLRTTGVYNKKHDNLSFTKKFKTFDFVGKGEYICTDGKEKITAESDQYILFPRDTYAIGIEAFLTAENI